MTRVEQLRDVAALADIVGDAPWERHDWLAATQALVPDMPRLQALRATDGGDSAWLLLGDDGEAWTHWYALRAGPILSGSPRADLLTAIARTLARRSSHVMLAPMDAERAAFTAAAFRAAGWWARDSEATANWVAHVGDRDFAAHWAARPSRLRNTWRRKARDAPFAIAIHDRFEADVWAAYESVYARSWKPNEGSPAFLRWMAETAGREGRLRLGIARDGDRPVAAQLWTIDGGVATIHKLAYDEADRARSPGTILGHAMFAHVIDTDRPALIDYGTGDEPYKAEWMDERRSLRRLSLFNPRTIGGLARAAKAALTR